MSYFGFLVILAWTTTKKCWKNVRDITQFRCPYNLPICVDGSVVKIKAFFGVKFLLRLNQGSAELTANDQRTRLLVSDPKALHSILVKVGLYTVTIASIVTGARRKDTHTKQLTQPLCE